MGKRAISFLSELQQVLSPVSTMIGYRFLFTVVLGILFVTTNLTAFKLSPIKKQAVKSSRCDLKMVDLPLIIDSSYNLAAGCAVVGTACGVLENFKGPTGKVFGAGAIAFTVFAAFIAFQTTNLRFQFDSTSFSLVKADGSSNGQNIVVGGENSWKYNTFVNYDFLPSEEFPILVYFKETQTPQENWVEVPIVVDQAAGQGHFFPAIANVAQLKAAFEQNKCTKL